jgi:ELWxxDGT repeat protein
MANAFSKKKRQLFLASYLTPSAELVHWSIFAANDGAHGQELWRSNGSPAGTYMVADINPSGGSYPGEFTNVNGTLFFDALADGRVAQLWRTDGTSSGTKLVKDLSPVYLTNVNGTVFFGARDSNGIELWKSNGSTDGTVVVKDFPPGTGDPYYLTNVKDTLFFVASDGSHGREL